MSEQGGSRPVLPRIAKRQLRLFAGYVAFYLKRNFHHVLFRQQGPLAGLSDWPILICLNHPSWWDPLMAVYLSQKFFAHRDQYAPIAAAGVARYRFFEKLGFFGIEKNTRAGAARFLEIGQAVLAERKGVFWVTAQGEFTDVRVRPVTLAAGVGHLAHRLERCAVLPLALEYAFWNERKPVAFACAGEPVFVSPGKALSSSEWTATFSRKLEETQDHLAACVRARRTDAFESLLASRSGVGGMYDLWRLLKSRWRGEAFHSEHESH